MEQEILFSKQHLWVRQDGDTVKIGISAYAAKELGGIVFLNLPETGEQLMAGEKLGDMESIKTVTDLISPVTGEVVSVNETMIEDPAPINQDPYANWLAEIKTVGPFNELMTEEEYQQYQEKHDV